MIFNRLKLDLIYVNKRVICLLLNWSETFAEIRCFDVISFYFLAADICQEIRLPDYEMKFSTYLIIS